MTTAAEDLVFTEGRTEQTVRTGQADFVEQEFGHPIGFFEMRVTRCNDRIGSEFLVVPKTGSHRFGRADKRCSRTRAHQTDACSFSFLHLAH